MDLRKNGEVDYKIFQKIDMENLINFFIKLNEEISTINEEFGEKYTEFRLEIVYKNGTSNVGQSLSVLTDTKEIASFDFSVKNIFIKKRASIVVNSRYSFGNSYSVESDDEDWVNAKFIKLSEIIENAPEQNQWLSNQKKQSTIIYSVGVTLGFILLISFVYHTPNLELDLLGNLITTYIAIAGGMYTSFKIFLDGIFPAYPRIEFDTTRDHLNKIAKRKHKIKGLVTLLAIPIAINLFFIIIF